MESTTIYNRKAEMTRREELEQLQLERLQATLNRAYRNVAFYRAAFDASKIDIESFNDLADIRRLPFTTQEDLRKSYPYAMFAVPLREIVRIHSSGGATSQPVVVGHTRNDMRNWVECAARVLVAAGVNDRDVVQFSLDCQHSSAGFGFQQGAEQIGASVIRAAGCSSALRQVSVMRDFKTSVLVCSPHHASTIVTTLEALQIHPERLHLKRVLVIGERWSERLRQHIESQLHVETFDAYGPPEIMAPGTAGECSHRRGLHVNEDHLVAEVVDPKTLQPLPRGAVGELVLTTITREGCPLIRYRTGDLTSLDASPCDCGRTFMRMARVIGRTDNLIQFRGNGFYPSQVDALLESACGTRPNYRIILDRQGPADTLEIRLEIGEGMPPLDEVRALETLRTNLAQQIKLQLDVDARVSFAEPRSLRESGAEIVVDRRPW
jgi:phenylacetate-CoA ligase